MNSAMPEAQPDTREILKELIARSGALTALLVTREGVSEMEAGDTFSLNTTAMAALVAGMFSATREVARMVGEKQFSILLQQGENRHIHISLIGESWMLVIIFADFQRIGLVRHEARRSSERLAQALTRAEVSRAGQEKIASPQFKEYAMNLIDRIFEAK